MSIAALTDDERVRIRHHLGFLNVSGAATFALGVPQAVEPMFAIERAFQLVLPTALGLVRLLLARCDATEAQRFDNQENLAVTSVCDIDLRADEQQALGKNYDYWRNALANALGVYANPFDKRDIGGSGLNVPVLG